MRSPGSWRVVGELALRVLLVAALAVALWRSVRPSSAAIVTRDATVRELPVALRDLSRDARVAALDLRADSMPNARDRAWLVALRRAGLAVRWQGTPATIAIEVQRTVEPVSHVRLLVAADSGAPLSIADSAGALDTLRVAARGGVLESAVMVGSATATRARWQAEAPVPAPPTPRAVLVLGRAGWESKFVAAALQETGWTVRARLAAAPGVVVADAGVVPIDTSRYAVVVALDSSAADLAATLARFVGQGGGLVLAGSAPHIAALRALAPAVTAARRPARIMLASDTVTRADLSRRPLDALRADAVRVEGTAAEPTVVARRAGLGRVITLAYDESWRWRMLGGTGGVDAHRTWWSRVVGLAAPEAVAAPTAHYAAAPYAVLLDALGPATPAAESARSDGGAQLPVMLLAAIVILLLAETASRRFRGAR